MNPFERMNQVPSVRESEPELEFEPEPESEDDEGVYESVAVPYGEPLLPESTEAVFDQNAAIENERGFLESLQGKARRVAKVMALVSVLSLGAGYSEDTYARDTDNTPRAEQVERSRERVPKEERLTSAGKFFQSITEESRADISKIQTREDAWWFAKMRYDEFISEYLNPTKVRVKKDSFGVKERDYSLGDLRSILENANEMKGFLTALHEKFEVDNYEGRIKQMDTIIKKVERESSYSGQMQKAAQEQLEKEMRTHRQRIKIGN